MPELISITKAENPKKKLTAHIKDASNKVRNVSFGASGYSDYPSHKDEARKQNYLTRHAPTEDWTASGIYTPGFWSRWILWNKPSIISSTQDVKSRFNL
jgi:hypothetical protein